MAPRDAGTKNLKGNAQKIMLANLPGELEDERNLAGIELTLSGAGEADGRYLLFEPVEKHPAFAIGNDHYTIALGRKNYALPFSLRLLEAEKEMHPGTDIARSYSSTVMMIDGDVSQRATITMNHQLRYKGYTVYQSSFNEGDGQQSVSFAVVKNSGRVFPYAASITLCLGLIVHLCLRLPTLFRRQSHEG